MSLKLERSVYSGIARDNVRLRTRVSSFPCQEYVPEGGVSYVSRQQGVEGESPAFTLIVGAKDNDDILQTDHPCNGPDDEGESPQQVLVRRISRKGGRKDIERAGADVTVDDTNRLIGKPAVGSVNLPETM